MRPDEKQPGFVLCVHCGEYEGKVACRGCRYLVCGACALADCPEAVAPSTNEPGRFYAEPVALDAATRTIQCNGQRARFDAVLEVIVETVVARGGELPFEYAVRCTARNQSDSECHAVSQAARSATASWSSSK